jgi:hypothetical protein
VIGASGRMTHSNPAGVPESWNKRT